ncbi:hypothetical protein EXIGLDRAFT_773374 [Exidia glandulosa HHB12029]|uniref:Ribosomal protein S8 n=1 Tax=Exidia glandulosa HHB12029 TaxID=1314781 RepID=A0A165EUT8_EXIGL|nr:hypothetical protein EXIGLDRAFT_773374 [Exidia glandulosa HHB12029]
MLAHDLCSTVQNAFRARHRLVALPHTTQSLGILTVLLQAGFLSAITRGTSTVPEPGAFNDAHEADRRIWAYLKYRDERPVLSRMHAVSVPSKRVFMDQRELMMLCTGRGVKQVKPLGMGEVAVIRTQKKENEWIEAREAVRLNVDRGELMCRAQ